MMLRHTLPALAALHVATAATAATESPALPVKEVTIFKDGHSFVLHQGELAVNADGSATLDYLPSPILGTFWPASTDKRAQLVSVTAASHEIKTKQDAVTLRQLLEANIGDTVLVQEKPISPAANTSPNPYKATILSLPQRTPDTPTAHHSTDPFNPRPFVRSVQPTPEPPVESATDLVLLQTAAGTKAVQISRIATITFPNDHQSLIETPESRHQLTFNLKWQDAPQETANLSMAYLQHGLKWTPSYHITLTDDHKAVVKLQGTLTNDLIDLNDVTANLVVGVPSFTFSGSLDPISLQQDIANLQFTPGTHTPRIFSNAIQTQAVGGMYRHSTAIPDSQPEVTNGRKNEDLFVFTVEHVSLKTGQCMVIPIAEYTLDYQDVFALDIPFSPPAHILPNLNQQQQTELLRLLANPKVEHKIRLKNNGQHPLTTAPALIVKNDQVLAQGMMTYAAVGGSSDITLTPAIDIHIKSTSNETKRTPNAVRWNGDDFTRIDLEGKLRLTNHKTDPVTVEITRNVLGNLDEVGNDGTITKVNLFEDASYLPNGSAPRWWHHYSWPWWWHHFNSVSKAKWTTTLDPGQSVVHDYSWHYFWR
ncbi:hypothetical protein [Sulfuriroseicoccus oceanibius]|uniref:DUF4139 domain-containing protein n=1 Tax=Sulfuriroseicoccus oceanibius TaxID=2707525 RepID=A0A6B3LBM8_9BACT|nr:hypothetical protein [Sulfuriroseicoccus oceanibius]QQL44682.1 hypothetical protein G3M56_012460 [Sulfuriroseicoccus oceanibius]